MNVVDNEQTKEFSEVLKINTTLTHLDLRYNWGSNKKEKRRGAEKKNGKRIEGEQKRRTEKEWKQRRKREGKEEDRKTKKNIVYMYNN